jgi:hypothetical protein
MLALATALAATRELFQDRRAEGASAAGLLDVVLVRVSLGTVAWDG